MKKILLVLVLVAIVGCSKEVEIPTNNTNQDEDIVENVEEEHEDHVEQEPRSTTTGLLVTDEFQPNPFSIMIENSPAARPQSGLAEADIVYELEVEGNITRFLAVFHDQHPEKVGPVRSSRHYYVPIAESFRIPYAHFGGSPLAYEAIEQLNIPTYDGMKYGSSFKRDSSRNAPHNAYFFPDTLDTFSGEIQSPFSFTNEKDNQNGSVHEISYSYNRFTKIDYEYDEESMLYTRFLEGEKHLDKESEEPIKVRNIIFITAIHAPISGDKSGRIEVDMKGSGDLILFTNGKQIKGSWKYKDEAYHYYDEDANLLFLTPGTTWVQVIRDTEGILTN